MLCLSMSVLTKKGPKRELDSWTVISRESKASITKVTPTKQFHGNGHIWTKAAAEVKQGNQPIINVEKEENNLVLWKDLAGRFSTSDGANKRWYF